MDRRAPLSLPLIAALLVVSGCGAGAGARSSTPEAGSPAARTSPVLPRPHLPSPTVRPRSAPPTATRPTPSSIVPTDLPTDVPLGELPVPSVAGRLVGADVSWPQCPLGMGIPQKRSKGLPGPLPSARFVVVGLTNGPGFVANPCLADQVRSARDAGAYLSAYAVASYPDAATLARYGRQGPYDGTTRLGALENVGYQQARFNLASLRAAGLAAPIVWIDVEPVPDFDWSSDRTANAAVVSGVARGYRDAGLAVGVYSTPLLYADVVGGLRLGTGVPEWRAAGQTSQAEALSRCGPTWTIQGGPGVLAQWVDGVRDVDLTCPGAVDVARYLTR